MVWCSHFLQLDWSHVRHLLEQSVLVYNILLFFVLRSFCSFEICKMGQKVGKKGVDKGLGLYKEQKYQEAAQEWLNVLKRTHRTDKSYERFDVIGYLCTVFYDMGKYRDVLMYADQQIDIANSSNDASMKAEAFFNLARGNERLSLFNKAVLFSKECLKVNPKENKTSGYAYLCLGNAYFGLSDFSNSTKAIDMALTIARQSRDRRLDLLANTSLGLLFCTLKDHETGLYHFERALDAMKVKGDNVNLDQYQRLLSACVAVPYHRKGRLNDAMESCEDALKMAMRYKDRPVQARCLQTFAEIHRKRKDVERAFPRYESAYSIYVEIGDRLGQMEVLIGMAKLITTSGDYQQAVELSQRALDIAESIENKYGAMQCNAALADLYSMLGDTEMTQSCENHVRSIVGQMELYCGICSETIGHTVEELYPLPCGHLIHNRCAPHLARYTWGRKGTRRPCPSCRVKLSGNPVLDQ